MPHREQGGLLNTRYLPLLWIACLLIPFLHFLLIRYGSDNFPFGFLFVTLGLIKIGVGFVWFRKLAYSPVRYRWLLLITGAALSNVSGQIYSWHYFFVNEPSYLSGPASFMASIASIPCLIAIASNFDRRDPRLVMAIDLGLCLMLGALFVAQIDAAMSMQPVSAQASALLINRLIDIQNVFLVACVSLQFFAADSVENRRFFYVFLGFMLAATPVLSFRNRMAMQYYSPLWDLGLDVPPLMFLYWL